MSWWLLIANGLRARAVAVDPTDSSTVYVGADNEGAFKSADGGATWSPLALGFDGLSVRDVLVDAHDSAVVYVATFGEGVLRSDDGGVSFAVVSASFESAYVYDLHQHPDGRLFATTSAGAYGSDDQGSTWSLLAGSYVVASADALVADPDDADTIYLGLRYGTVVRSVDGGATFEPFEAGFAGSRTTRLLFTADRRLIAATQDNGAFEVVTDDSEPGELPAFTGIAPDVRHPAVFDQAQDLRGGGCNQAAGAGVLPVWLLVLSVLLLAVRRRSR